MTTFDRSGHFRTNQHGNTFWVSGHSVSRDDWPSGIPRPVTRVYGHNDAISPSRNITIPNARCPQCYQPVFFFIAANGGRVFFDDLGPPWPKHRCMIATAVDVPAFADAGAILRWQQERRGALGPTVTDDDLGVHPGCSRGTARIVRRRGKTIAVVDVGDGQVAFEVGGAWQGRSSKTVYFRRVDPPGIPETLEYLSPGLSETVMRVIASVEVPTRPSSDDFPAIAEMALDEVEAWMRTHLPTFVPGPRLKIGGHRVGISGRIGRSRAVIMPLAAWFDTDEDGTNREDADLVRSVERQVREWEQRVVRMLDRSERTRKDALFRDVFVWLAPKSSWAFDSERVIRDYNREGRSERAPIGSLGPPPVHVVQTIGDGIEEEIRETRFGFDELARAERAYIIAEAKRRVEKRWLAAVLRDAGLDPVFAQLERDGVLFQFMGTVMTLPTKWGQQALLPDGRRLLVLLHLSNHELGLAFVHFGAPSEDEYGDETYPADAIFHAKRIRSILEILKTGADSD